MSFFSQSNRFFQKNRIFSLGHFLDMSPGPATYEKKVGFENVKWKDNDVRSPTFMRKRKKSLQLAMGYRSPHSGFGNNTKNDIEVTIYQNEKEVKKTTQGAIMQELYGRLVTAMSYEIKDLKKGIFSANNIKDNGGKEEFIKERNKMYENQLMECRGAMSAKENNVNEVILSGDVAVKVIRVATGKAVGPGSYYPPSPKWTNSHNLKGVKQFQELTVRQSLKKDTSQIISTFYESKKSDLTKILNSSKEFINTSHISISKKSSVSPWRTPVRSPAKRAVPVMVQAKPLSPDTSEICDQTVTTDDGSKILTNVSRTISVCKEKEGKGVQKSNEAILIEPVKVIQNECFRKKTVTPVFNK